MRRPRVFASRRFPDSVRAALDASFELDLHNSEWPPSREELLAHAAGCDGLMLMLTDRADDELLDATGPQLRVLVTSRELLRISGEHVYTVSPLDEADRVQLFMERARSARANLLMTDGDLATITAICARVDGLPLAIELAAGRVRLFRPTALLARLERRLPLLSGGPRDHTPRQQALRAAIAWSTSSRGRCWGVSPMRA